MRFTRQSQLIDVGEGEGCGEGWGVAAGAREEGGAEGGGTCSSGVGLSRLTVDHAFLSAGRARGLRRMRGGGGGGGGEGGGRRVKHRTVDMQHNVVLSRLDFEFLRALRWLGRATTLLHMWKCVTYV